MVKFTVPLSILLAGSTQAMPNCIPLRPSHLKNGRWVSGQDQEQFYKACCPYYSEFFAPANGINGIVNMLNCGFEAKLLSTKAKNTPQDGKPVYLADIDSDFPYNVDEVIVTTDHMVFNAYKNDTKVTVGIKNASTGEFDKVGDCTRTEAPNLGAQAGVMYQIPNLPSSELFFDCNGMIGDQIMLSYEGNAGGFEFYEITVDGTAVQPKAPQAAPVYDVTHNNNAKTKNANGLPDNYQDFIGSREDGNMPVCQKQLDSNNMCGVWLNCHGLAGGLFTKHCPTTCDLLENHKYYPRSICNTAYKLGNIRQDWFRIVDNQKHKKACYKRGGPRNPIYKEVCFEVNEFLDF